MEVSEKIKNRIIKLFEPTLKVINKQSICEHTWKDKNGGSVYRCKKCGYTVMDSKLDKLIHTQILIDKGMTPQMYKKFKAYI